MNLPVQPPDRVTVLQRQLLDRIGVGVFVIDLRSESISYVNDTLLAWLGVPSRGHLGIEALRQSLPNDQMGFRELESRLRRDDGRLETSLRKLISKDDTCRWIRSTFELAHDESEIPFVTGVIHDVTREKDSIEKAYEQSSLHSQLFDAAPTAIATVDNEDRVVRVNPAFERLFGYSESEARGEIIDDLIVPDNLKEEALKYSAGARSTQPVQVETVRKSKIGTLIPVQIPGFPLRLHGGQVGFHAIYTDRTEQTRVEDELNQLFDAAPCEMAMIDNGDRIVKLNAAFERLFGYAQNEAQGRVLDDLIVPEELRDEGREYSARARISAFLELESIRKLRDGRPVPVLIQVFPILHEQVQAGFYAIYTDLTMIKKAEAQLRQHRDQLDKLVKLRTQELEESQQSLAESELRYRTYLAKAPIGVGVVSLQGRIVEVNEAMSHLTGFSESELKKKSIADLISPGDFDDLAMRVERLLASQEQSNEVLGRTKDRGDRYFLVTTTSLGAEGFLVYAIDIHERRSAQQELERSNSELEQFAYIASHDLQEPLRMVGSFTGLLGRRYGEQLDEKGRKYIQFAVDGASRMQGLIDDLLTYSRVGRSAIQCEDVSLGDVVKQVEVNLQRRIEDEGATILTADLPVVSGDRLQLEQLFQNLFQNAIKFRREEASPEIRVSAEFQHGAWRITVADNCIGIPEQYQSQIFEIFQRLHTRDEYEGAGIGLSVCRKIVERHGGRMGVESDGDCGTTFWLTLSRAKEEIA